MLSLFMQKGRRTWENFDEVRKAAEEGDAQAQCYLGVCYQNGQGVKQDYQEAVKWFKKSADQNDSVAQCYLGVCYQAGFGVPQEYGQAAKW
ncbi:MAG TPA: tetratricopeptide repeat protein, partial [Candidatus Polarisedimenticolia bacterium]|nr:tetratricopeptide repeat protein [Candidatus Polarisedimenticolia bacterium]